MKPLLHRRTFWKGAASGAAAMAALIMGSVVAVSLAAPEVQSRERRGDDYLHEQARARRRERHQDNPHRVPPLRRRHDQPARHADTDVR